MKISNKQSEYIKRYKKRKWTIFAIRLSIIIFFILLWEILANLQIINPFISSSPSRIIKCLISLYKNNNLFIHIFITLKEILISFAIGISLGFIIAIIFYENNFIYQIFEPLLVIFNSLPKVALGPIIIILFGANIKSIIVMSILINMIVSITTIYTGFINTDYIKIKLFNTFHATKWQKLKYLIIPNSLNNIINTLKLNISLTLIGVITGEFLVSKQGIGYLIIYGTQVFNLNLVMVGILLLLIISFILYEIINKLLITDNTNNRKNKRTYTKNP